MDVSSTRNNLMEAVARALYGNCANNPKIACTISTIDTLAVLALLVLGSLALANVFPAKLPAFGYGVAGMATLSLSLNLSGGKIKERKFLLLAPILSDLAMIVAGGLCASNILSTHQLGCVIVAGVGSAFLVGLIFGCYGAKNGFHHFLPNAEVEAADQKYAEAQARVDQEQYQSDGD